MKLFIKNMVCNRCVSAVQQVLHDIGLQPEKVSLGEIDLKEESISESALQQLDGKLQSLGFERIDDRKARLIEGIKSMIIQLIHHREGVNRRYNWSKILADEMHYDYNYLSSLFSSVEGVTIEQYIIRQKIERAKELLFYDELNLSEIAIRLGYSSVAHLSSQFKKVTGMTPSELKKGRNSADLRKPLDSVK